MCFYFNVCHYINVIRPGHVFFICRYGKTFFGGNHFFEVLRNAYWSHLVLIISSYLFKHDDLKLQRKTVTKYSRHLT